MEGGGGGEAIPCIELTADVFEILSKEKGKCSTRPHHENKVVFYHTRAAHDAAVLSIRYLLKVYPPVLPACSLLRGLTQPLILRTSNNTEGGGGVDRAMQ